MIKNYDDIKNIFGVCSCCGSKFYPKIKNGKVVGMKYYCSDKCYETPFIQSFCKYCNAEILISAKELRNRRGKKKIVCDAEECNRKRIKENYLSRDFKKIYESSKKQKNCIKCNKAFIGSNLSLYCKECSYKMFHKICKNCGKEFELARSDSDIEVCDSCIIGEPKRYVGYCKNEIFNNCKFSKNCSKYFYYDSPKNKICQKYNLCKHELNPLYCQECSPREKVQKYNELIKIGQTIKIDNSDMLILQIKDNNANIKTYNKTCKCCKREFKGLGPTSNYCNCCFYILECRGCGLKFISVNKNALVCSQECSGIYFHKNDSKLILGKNIYNGRNFNINCNLNLEKFTEITSNNINNFDGISGIWFKVNASDEGNKLLDVCLTTDIKKEVEYHYWAIESCTNRKYSLIRECKNNIKLYYLCSIDSWEDGLIKEMEFALNNNATLWSPAPGQKYLFNNMEKNI